MTYIRNDRMTTDLWLRMSHYARMRWLNRYLPQLQAEGTKP